MTIMMHAAMETEAASLSASVKEATTSAIVFSFDEAQVVAKAGDVIKCTKAVTGPTFFTKGGTYEFIMGGQMLTDGVITIRDNGGVETPPDHVCPGRIPLLDEFVFVDREEVPKPVPVVEPTLEAPAFPLSNDRMKELAEECLEKLLSEAHEEHNNLRENRANNNKFNGFDTDKSWDEMSDADKAAVLLAVHNGERVQFHAPWTWGDEWITVAEGIKLNSFSGVVAYRPAPPMYTTYTEAMDAVDKRIRELNDELNDLRGEDEDEFLVDFW